MADSLALPVAIQPDGRFRRTDGVEAAMRLIGVMATTHQSFWPHAPWFGLLEMFAEANADVSELPRITDAINAALKELGAGEITVLTVKNARGVYGERCFEISMRDGRHMPVVRHVNA